MRILSAVLLTLWLASCASENIANPFSPGAKGRANWVLDFGTFNSTQTYATAATLNNPISGNLSGIAFNAKGITISGGFSGSGTLQIATLEIPSLSGVGTSYPNGATLSSGVGNQPTGQIAVNGTDVWYTDTGTKLIRGVLSTSNAISISVIGSNTNTNTYTAFYVFNAITNTIGVTPETMVALSSTPGVIGYTRNGTVFKWTTSGTPTFSNFTEANTTANTASLALDEANGKVWLLANPGVANTRLWSIDISTGAVSLVASNFGRQSATVSPRIESFRPLQIFMGLDGLYTAALAPEATTTSYNGTQHQIFLVNSDGSLVLQTLSQSVDVSSVNSIRWGFAGSKLLAVLNASSGLQWIGYKKP